MKAPPFRYEKARSVEDALELKARHGSEARYLAGGQSLLASLNFRLDHPKLLIDINGLDDLAGVVEQDGTVRIGALVRHKQIERDPVLARHLPLLAATVRHVAHPAIRTRGTFGGSVALGDPAAEWPACCLALDATIVARSREGERRIAAADFFQGPYRTALGPDELLVRVEIPSAAGARVASLELARRRGDYATAGIVADRASDRVRVAFFAVSDRPVRLRDVEDALAAGDVSRAQEAVSEALQAAPDLVTSAAVKTHLARVLVGRAGAELGLTRVAA